MVKNHDQSSRKVKSGPPVPDSVAQKYCPRCKHDKPVSRDKSISQFYFMHPSSDGSRDIYYSFCKQCNRIRTREYQCRDHVKEKIKLYRTSDLFKKKRRERDRRYYEKRRAAYRKYQATPLGKLTKLRRKYRYEIKSAKTETRRQRLEELVEQHTREIERIRNRVTEESRVVDMESL